MEFFERAHVPKKESAKKDSKSEEKVKKQLKQMLYGYKKSDNELIKNIAKETSDVADSGRCLDDSASVSGFSDLNLTESSNDAENSQETVESRDRSTTDFSELDLSDDKQKEGSLASLESLSDEDDIHSLSEDLTEGSDSTISDNLSLITSSQGTSASTDSDSEEFDPDGSLAKEIMKNLNAKEKAMKEKCNKRKIDKIEKQEITEIEVKPVKKAKKKKNKKAKKNIAQVEETIVADSVEESSIGQLSDDMSDTNDSTEYISISATEMPVDTLGDILEDYKHSTVKNIPSEKLNIVSTTNFSLPVKNLNSGLDNVVIVDDSVDSSIPDVDDDDDEEDDATLDDLESENDEDMVIGPFEEPSSNGSMIAFNSNDDTLQSDDASDNEIDSEPYFNPVKVFYGTNCCVFVLKHPAELYLHGMVKVSALAGTVEVLGYTLKEEGCEIYAPNCSYAHCFKTIETPNTYYGLYSKLTKCGLTGLESENIATSIGLYDGVICIYPLKCTLMDFVEANFSAADLFSKPSRSIDTSLKKASEFLRCSLYRSRPNKCFEELPIWEKALEHGFKERSRGIVCGGKGTGKSTFLRYYVNKLLAKGPVVVIDLDPGQPEFTPAGNVSATVITEPILGPNFTHLKTPEVMFQIAMINTMDNPRLYMDAVYNVFLHLDMEERFADMRWVINTMGMCNNMGFRIINAIILQFKPTFVLQIHSKNIKKRFEQKLHCDVLRNLFESEYSGDYIFNDVSWPDDLNYELLIADHEMSDIKKSPLAPRDERYLNFLAYFGELAAQHNGDILGIVPYEVDLRHLNIGTNVKVPKGTIAKVINGQIVALCEVETEDKGFTFTVNHAPIPCFGYGLVRGVDHETGKVFIITGLGVDKLPLVNAAVYSDWTPELRIGDHLPAGTLLPYRTASHYDHRQLMFPPRRRFNPIQLLKMSRNS